MNPAPEAIQREWNAAVLRMARECPYPEWMLLELPNGMYGGACRAPGQRVVWPGTWDSDTWPE